MSPRLASAETALGRVGVTAAMWLAEFDRRIVTSALLRQRHEWIYHRRLAEHRPHLPVLNPGNEAIATDLATASIAIGSLEFDPVTGHAASDAVAVLSRAPRAQAVTRLPLSRLDEDPALFLWGLNESNLDMAERHIGLPVRYNGFEVKVERVATAESWYTERDWHLDIEDRRMLKIIVYLNDVDDGAGPFEYVPQAASDCARRQLRCRPGVTFLSDTELASVVPRAQWRAVTGPSCTAVYADPSRLIHRAKPPTTRDRYSVTFVYTSEKPYLVFPRFMPPKRVLHSLADRLTTRQRRTLNGFGTESLSGAALGS